MRALLYICIGIILSILESAIFTFLPFEFFKPDLGLPLILYVSFFLEPQVGLIVSIFIGLTQEVFSSAPHGSIFFTKLSLFLIALFLKNKVYVDTKYSFSYYCGIFVIIESFLFIALSLVARGDTKNMLNVLFYTLPNAVFTGFLSLFVLPLVSYVNVKLSSRG